jgi:hypothetical protein
MKNFRAIDRSTVLAAEERLEFGAKGERYYNVPAKRY